VKEFPNAGDPLRVLNGVELDVRAGEAVAIVGESGSGKSTLLSLVAGLDEVTEGEISVTDRRVDQMSEAQLTAYRSTTVGLVFQFHHLLRDFTAVENVMLPLLMRRVGRLTAHRRAAALLEQLGLSDRKEHLPAQLSGGERQRVAVARALVTTPRIVLADEPTGNLDERNSELVATMLFNLVREQGATLLLVTHDGAIASRADRTLELEGGTIRRE
jgi:lipoprotein-releasing system ATP-binding protein